MKMDALLNRARSQEASEEQAKRIEQMQSTSEAVNVLQYKTPPPRDWQSPQKKTEGQNTCRNCGFLWPQRMACVQQKVKHATSVGK